MPVLLFVCQYAPLVYVISFFLFFSFLSLLFWCNDGFTELLTAETSLNSVLDSPKVEGSRRRPRWKWSPISTQILSEAFKKVAPMVRELSNGGRRGGFKM